MIVIRNGTEYDRECQKQVLVEHMVITWKIRESSCQESCLMSVEVQ